jgi:hypothetical protein
LNPFASAIAGAIVLNVPTIVWAMALPVVATPIGAVALLVMASVLALVGAAFGVLLVWALEAPAAAVIPVVDELPLAA